MLVILQLSCFKIQFSVSFLSSLVFIACCTYCPSLLLCATFFPLCMTAVAHFVLDLVSGNLSGRSYYFQSYYVSRISDICFSRLSGVSRAPA